MNSCKKYSFKIIILLLILLLTVVFAIAVGSYHIPVYEIFSGDKSSVTYKIIVYARLPRVIAGLIAGSGLAVSGALLQSVLNNSLASPGIIGINAGAGLVAVIFMTVFPASIFAKPFGAFIGAFLSAMLVWAISSKTGASKSTVILTGVAVSSLFTAILDAVITCYPELQLDRLSFAIGGFENLDYKRLIYLLPFYIAGMIGSFLISYDVNVLYLGDETAGSLGLNIKRTRGMAILFSALLAGTAVSIAGLLGFVGLVVPHIMGWVIGKDNRILFPATSISGAILTVFSDTLARSLFAPFEVPVGILLSLIGAPFFLVLIFKRRRHS